MKYKMAGITNFVIAGVQLIVAFTLILVVIPQMQGLYREFNAQVLTYQANLIPILNIILGAFNIFLGYKLFITKGKAIKKYFLISIVYLVITFITAGILAQLSVLSMIKPIYNLPSSLE